MVQDRVFFQMGQLIAMSVVQGGCGFPFFSEAVFDYICHGDVTIIHVDPNDLSDGVLRVVVCKVHVHNYTSTV